jgi:hypothetical protein
MERPYPDFRAASDMRDGRMTFAGLPEDCLTQGDM